MQLFGNMFSVYQDWQLNDLYIVSTFENQNNAANRDSSCN